MGRAMQQASGKNFNQQNRPDSCLAEMMRKSVIAERVAADTYDAFLEYLQSDDSATRRIMEKILEMEEADEENTAIKRT